MAGRVTGTIDVRRLTEHDVVDQSCRGLVFRRQLWDSDTGQDGLQAFDQVHEIPYRKDMDLHESV